MKKVNDYRLHIGRNYQPTPILERNLDPGLGVRRQGRPGRCRFIGKRHRDESWRWLAAKFTPPVLSPLSVLNEFVPFVPIEFVSV